MKNFSLDVNNRNIILFILFIGLFIFHGCSSSSDEGIGMNPNLSPIKRELIRSMFLMEIGSEQLLSNKNIKGESGSLP